MTDLPIPTLEAMRTQWLEDFEYCAIDSGVDSPPIGPGSDAYARATANANLMTVALDNISAVESDIDPRTCSDEQIEQKRITLGLPEVLPTGAIGKGVADLTGTSGTILDGQQATRNGMLYRVVGNWVGLTQDAEFDIQATDTGSATDVDGGDKLTWYPSAPPGFKSEFAASKTSPITGGTDPETPARKRERVVEAYSTQAGGMNWAHVRKVAEEAVTNIKAYVYPCLGGPSSCLVVCTKDIDPDTRDWSRAPTEAMLQKVRQAIWSNCSDHVVVRATGEEPTSVSLEVTIPDATSAGGNGLGWINSAPWPTLESGDSGRVTVTAVTSTKQVTVSALTTTSAVAGQTYVDWWCPGDQCFVRLLVTVVSGGTGAWVLTFDKPCVDSDNVSIATGDYICPASANSTAYAATWRSIMAKLGPGEATVDSYRLPRASRHPTTSAQDSPTLSAVQKKDFQNTHSEVSDVDYGYRSSTTPTVPGTVSTPPYTLTLDNFGIYPL